LTQTFLISNLLEDYHNVKQSKKNKNARERAKGKRRAKVAEEVTRNSEGTNINTGDVKDMVDNTEEGVDDSDVLGDENEGSENKDDVDKGSCAL
jgi:hypothetical protein